MRLKVSLLLAAGALLVAMIVPSTASAHGTHVRARMDGSKVVGQPGAPAGEGTAKLHLLRGKQRVCFRIEYSGIGNRNGMDIRVYRGRKGENGDPKITLVQTEKKDPIEGCVDGVSKRLLKKITRSPRRFHVTLKTAKYPVDGAIRGQLKPI
jgi:CHRD domain